MQHIAITMPGRAITAPLLIECDLSREGISLAVEALIAKLDTMDGDSDVELNGDETDGGGAEDEACAYFQHNGPGCTVSDPDGYNGDEDDHSVGGDARDYRHHRDRIRATRCDTVGHRLFPEYRLRGAQ